MEQRGAKKQCLGKRGAVLYKKRYGRMTVSAWLNSELEQTKPILMVIVGTLLLLIGGLVRLGVGSPYRMMLELGIGDLVPPVWLFTLLQLLGFLTVGCYTLAKDTRTGYEDGNIQSVMDGNIDGFINAYLKMNSGK